MSTIGPLGAHTSANGGGWKALLAGVEIGATTIQFFTANQRRWHSAPLTDEAVTKFRQVHEETGLTHLMSHASYLLNLGSPDPTNLAKSRTAFREEISRCQALGVTYLNFHPGAALKGTKTGCLERIVESLLGVEDLLVDDRLRLLVETTAGQGSLVGAFFEEVGFIVKKVANRIPIGVCLDTCHTFAAGYDIRTAAGWESTLDSFEKEIGLQYLYAMHLNDSRFPLGARKDRHASLGTGEIGFDSFAFLMRSPKTRHLAKYLETPNPTLWPEEIQRLRSLTIA